MTSEHELTTATSEISRVQLWQWAKYGTKTSSGKTINLAYLKPIFAEESAKVAKLPGISAKHVQISSDYMLSQVAATWPSEFLTSDLQGHLEGGSAPRKAAL